MYLAVFCINSAGLKDLLKELQQVTEWHNLGLHLDVPEHKLNDIQESNSGNTDDCRREMLMVWMELEVATWARVIHALIHIHLPVLAANIASKYGKQHIRYIDFGCIQYYGNGDTYCDYRCTNPQVCY